MTLGIAEDAAVADLAAALGIEGRLVQDDEGIGRGIRALLHVGAGLELLVLRAVADDGHDLPARRGRLVAQEAAGILVDGRFGGPPRSGTPGPGHDPRRPAPGDAAEERHQLRLAHEVLPGARAGTLALASQGGLEPLAVDTDAILRRQLHGQVDGEAVGVMEAEGRLAVEARGVLGHVLRTAAHHALRARQRDEGLLELHGPRVERAGEGRLLAHDGTQDGPVALAQDGIGIAHEVDDDLGGGRQEGLVPAEQPTMPHGTADDPAQDVAAPLVGGQDTVRDEERDGPRVVGDDLVAEALRLEGFRVVSEELPHARVDGREEVRVVVAADALEHRGQALETHARVHGAERQGHTRSVGLLVELHEDEVPELQPARAVLAVVGQAVGTLAELRSPVVVDLAAGTAGTGVRHAPEVLVVAGVHVTPARHALRGQADLVAPDAPRLLVVPVGRGGQSLRGDAQVHGQELPGPVDGLPLEVVAERPVAEHLEERVVPRRASHLLEVVVLAGDPQAALRVHGARVGCAAPRRGRHP